MEDDIIAYLGYSWDTDVCTLPLAFTTSKTRLNYVGCVSTTMRNLTSEAVASAKIESYDALQVRISHPQYAAGDHLRDLLVKYPVGNFLERFDGDLSNWTIVGGSPSIVSGELKVPGNTGNISIDLGYATDRITEVEFVISASDVTKMVIMALEDSGNNNITGIKIDGSKIYYLDSVGWQEIGAAVNDAGYTCTFTNINFITHTFDLAVDGTPVTTDIAFSYDGSEIQYLRATCQESGGFGYFDDIIVRNVNFAELDRPACKPQVVVDYRDRDKANNHVFVATIYNFYWE